MNIINLTPYPITAIDQNGSTKVFRPSGEVIYCTEHTEPAGIFEGISTVFCIYGKPYLRNNLGYFPENNYTRELREIRENTFYLVPNDIRTCLPERNDLLSPGDFIRDEAGRILGFLNFVRNKEINE